ncbi:endonuclease/exonuclease/phosphatase family protein [Sphingomonas sp. LY29]|uniref:endonuclease/exonuclease/phosphatase family protein n=1 Tax=unclassified Sphingomonas TaxID=196159 RepID=UPI002ADEDC84|nr:MULTISPECIES: endonuclease/exonuclease/phosphatase family protein [unclassified Sphingomonas]MEA1072341.1 endonuclease/exonuclease/phosphatase family protein [Sphingomonas sp. LY160]WRP24991.1 endonuclease/exonuclease/phosphatase family protein [Sphingomonas sp. LY29]
MTASPTITVASYNMRKAIGIDRKRNPDRILDVLRQIDADVVALQEADKRFGTRASAVPHELIDGHGLYKPVEFGVSHSRLAHAFPFGERLETRLGLATRNLGWHGNALLVKRDVEVIDMEALHLPTLEPRGAVMAELDVRGQHLRVIGMHLDLSGLWRRRQVRSIIAHLAKRHRPMPTVLMGDTNEWRAAGGCLGEFGDCYRIAPTGPSFHSRRPIASLDRILVHTSLRIEAAGVHASPEARKGSDHLPVWARLGV